MKKYLLNIFLAVSLIVTPVLLVGCKTTQSQPQTTQQKIELGARLASQIGATVVLSEKPEYRAGFEQAVEDLKILENAPENIGISQVLAIIQRLDVKELKSPTAVLYISTGVLLITEIGGGNAELPLETSNSVKGVAKAIRIGLEVALQATAPPE